jgi:hypothetical protein
VGQMNTRSTGIPSNARKTAFRFFLAGRGSVDSPSSVPASSEGPVSGFWLGIASTNIRSVLLSVPVRRANFLSVFLLAHIIQRRSSPKLFPVEAALLEVISASSDWRQSSHRQKTAGGIVRKCTEGRVCTDDGEAFAASAIQGYASGGLTGEDGTSVACLMLESGFLTSLLLSRWFFAEPCGCEGVVDLASAAFDLCRGRGATKISVSGLTSTAVLGFVGGLVSSVNHKGAH